MSAPVEKFSMISPVTYDQSSALTHELKVLSERPNQPDNRIENKDSSTYHLPEVTVHDGTTPKPKPEESHLGALGNTTLNFGIAAAVVVSAEVLGAVLFRSPKLAEAALESASGSTKLGLAATETAALTSKFGFLTSDAAAVLGKTSIYAGSTAIGIGVRHYSYAELTGQQESWKESSYQVARGLTPVVALKLTGGLMKGADKVWPNL